jgi:hypothetical protein
MSHKGSVQVTILFTCSPEHVAEGDALFSSHAEWMEQSHYRDGDLALLAYNVTKAPELSNPLDPGSESTGNTVFSLVEVYATQAGLDDHWARGSAEDEMFGAFVGFANKCTVATSHNATVVQSLW